MRINSIERQFLYAKKVKAGKSYEQAFEEVEKELKHLEELSKKQKANKKTKRYDFKTEFNKLKNGNKQL